HAHDCDSESRQSTLGNLLHRPGICPSPRRSTAHRRRSTHQTRCRGSRRQTWLCISMGAPGHCRASKTGAMASSKEKSTATFLHAQAFTQHPRLTMKTPTTAQLRTAIEVLKRLEDRIDKHA